MKNKIFISLLFICSMGLWSCNDFLDLTPTDKVTDKIVWQTENGVTDYVTGFYPYINIYGQFGGGDSQVGLTEGLTETLKYNSMVPGTNVGFANIVAFAEGGMPVTTASFQLGDWANLYNRIRRVNEFLFGLKKYSTLSAEKNTRFEAEARFFRGFLYFQLIKRTKTVLLYDDDITKITRHKALSTETEGWNMVQADLTFAAKNLPKRWNAANEGRVTKGASWALLSRAMLYAERWQVAKDACDSVFKLGYSLVPGTTAADYKKAFTAGSSESILEFKYSQKGPSQNFDVNFTPGGDASNSCSFAVPTQEMVESYEKAGTGGFPDWSAFHAAGGTTATPPYAALEPRFHASILYNGADWKGRKIKSYVGGTEGWADFNVGDPNLKGKTTTSYFLRKLVDESHTDLSATSKGTQPWIAIRLAEVYLNRAEACYRLNDAAGANNNIREIRTRVGLPYDNKDGADLFNAIRQERKVELFVEGHLYWDMRRWKLAEAAYSGANSRVHGFKISQSADGLRYEYIDCDKQNRSFLNKMYRIPLPEEELNNNSLVKQFPEWK